MAATLGAILRKVLLRWLIYLLGLVIVVGLLGVGAFVVARPQIDEIVQRELNKRGVEADGWDVNLSGRVDLHNMRVKLPDGTTLQARLAALRPPLAGFTGAATLYDVTAEHGEITLSIPELDIDGIVMREKDTRTPSRVLQAMMQFDIATLTAPKIHLTMPADGKAITSDIEGLALDGFERGKINRLRLATMTSRPNDGSMGLSSGSIDVRDIDVAAAYAYLSGRLDDGWQPGDGRVIGPLTLNDVKIDVVGKKETDAGETETGKGEIHVAMGSLNSNGLALRSVKKRLTEMVQSILKGEEVEENLRQLVESFTVFDLTLGKVDVGIGRLQTGFQSLSIAPRDWHQLVPEGVALKIDGFILDSSNLDGEVIEALKEIGYGRMEFSLDMDANWDKMNRRFVLTRLDVEIKDAGAASMTGAFTNVDEALFSGDDSTQMMAAMQDIALHELDITLTDHGAIQHFVLFLTSMIDISAEEVMEHLETIVIGSAATLFEDKQKQQTTAEALLAFLRQAARLKIHMMTNGEGDGLTLATIGDSFSDMHALTEQLHITFSHEGG